MRKARVGAQTGTETEIKEEGCLLAFYPWHPYLPFLLRTLQVTLNCVRLTIEGNLKIIFGSLLGMLQGPLP